MCGPLLCGGQGQSLPTGRSCLLLEPLSLQFQPASLLLQESRAAHLCWQVEGGDVLLLGGQTAPTSTELVSMEGESSQLDFTLEYEIK